MKFSHQFQDILAKEGFPPSWVQHAISYGQLKKCIKKVQRELLSLGLNVDTVRELLQPLGSPQREKSSGETKRPVIQYSLAGESRWTLIAVE